jgi:hypothetical protein
MKQCAGNGTLLYAKGEKNAYEKEIKFGACFLCRSTCHLIRYFYFTADHLRDLCFVYQMESDE